MAPPYRCAAATDVRLVALRAVLLLALAAGASSTPCAPGRENHVDGASVTTDTVSNVNGVTLAGCNITVTRTTPGSPVTVTGSDDVVLLNVAASVTVTGSFDAVVGNDVQAAGDVTVTGDFNAVAANNVTHLNQASNQFNVVGDRNVAESNSVVDHFYLGGHRNASGNTIVGNTVTNSESIFDYGFEARRSTRPAALRMLALVTPQPHAPLPPSRCAVRSRRPRRAACASAAMSDPEGWDPVADTVGAGIYSGKVKRDAAGVVVYGQQYAGHNPRPGPLYAGGGYTEMAQAIQRGPEAVAALLAAGADANEEMTGGARPLHTCGMSRRGQTSVRVLLGAGAVVDALDTYGYTPLHRMASNDLAIGAQALIEAGADVNALTAYSNQTPLFIARFSGADDVAQVLLDAGGREY